MTMALALAAVRLALSYNPLASVVAAAVDAEKSLAAVCEKQLRAATALPEFSLADVSEHYTSHDCWIVIYDKVYDVTEFLNEHPGGEYIILEFAGRDATIAFRGSRHGKDSYEMLAKYCVGVLIESERLYTDTSTTGLRYG